MPTAARRNVAPRLPGPRGASAGADDERRLVMNSDAKQASEKTGWKLIGAYIPDLSSFKSIVYIAMCSLVPLVLAHFINLIGWWAPPVSTAAWNVLAFYLMSRMPRNAEKIRGHYRAKYDDQAYQQFFYRYVVLVIGPCTIGFLVILAVENSSFLPALYPYDHVLYRTLSPWWVFVPIGIVLLLFSMLTMRKSINGGFDRDTELFLYIIHPEKSFPIQGGMYQYVRHAHYAEGIWMGIALAFLAQNWMGFIMAFMMFLEYYAIARVEDKELIRRYGASFETYARSKPMFFPRLRDLGSFVKLVLFGS
jgi:protein-S-isoprenylcysteine O-methyltransferase Ste14